MNIEFQKVTEAIEKTSPEIRRMMFSAKLGEELQNISEANKLDEEKTLQFVDEVGYVVLGLKQRISFLDSLIQIGVEKGAAEIIKKEVEGKIFSELDKIKNNSLIQKPNIPPQPQNKPPLNQTHPIGVPVVNKLPQQIHQPKPEPPKEVKNNIGDSFEQAILNQAKAMQVAKPAQNPKIQDLQIKPTPPGTSMPDFAKSPPTNLPGTEAITQPEKPKPAVGAPKIGVPDYSGKSDPYRESIQ